MHRLIGVLACSIAFVTTCTAALSAKEIVLTQMVKDIYPGVDDSEPEKLFLFNGTVFFSADDGTYGRELWKSDGTEAGTQMVKDINPGSADAWPGTFTEFDGMLYFTANDGTHGIELWRSDGTAGGTILAKDIQPGTNGSNPCEFNVLNDLLLFKADSGTSGIELWKATIMDRGDPFCFPFKTMENRVVVICL